MQNDLNMSEARETAEYTLPVSGVKVKMLTYITGREKRRINETLFDNMEIKQDTASGMGEAKNKVSGKTINEMEDKQIEIIVKEFDGKTEGIVDLVLDSTVEDVDFVMEKIAEVVGKKK